jgi:hypothetical protein
MDTENDSSFELVTNPVNGTPDKDDVSGRGVTPLVVHPPSDAGGLSTEDGSARKIGRRSAAALLMTWSTSSSNVMYPWTFGVLGWVLGPVSV